MSSYRMRERKTREEEREKRKEKEIEKEEKYSGRMKAMNWKGTGGGGERRWEWMLKEYHMI